MRKSWDAYFMNLAYSVAERSTCPRRKVGAVIVRNKRIVATGYNGAPAGLPHCTTDGCYLDNGHCIRAIHAEVNALLECAPMERENATLYVTDYPCQNCAKLIINSGIRRVVYDHEYAVDVDWFKLAPWIEVVKFEESESVRFRSTYGPHDGSEHCVSESSALVSAETQARKK